jgi:hypothetical protein
VGLVTPEYIAHATLQKSGLLVVGQAEHPQKMMQSRPIAFQVTTNSRTPAIRQPLFQELLNMGLVDLPPSQPPPEVLDDVDIGSAMPWDVPPRSQVLRVPLQDQTHRFGADTPTDMLPTL